MAITGGAVDKRFLAVRENKAPPAANLGLGGINPFRWADLNPDKPPTPVEIPDIITFVTHPGFLDRPNLYPRQATILKVMFLREDLMTDYDFEVIAGWEKVFAETGNEGISPGVLDRIRINREAGRRWFRETNVAVGRRGGKGYIGALAGAYVLWNYMAAGSNMGKSPQDYYAIDRDKRLTANVFAGKKEQAQANQWGDLVNVIQGGPCFAPYISKPQTSRLTVMAPTDKKRAQKLVDSGIKSERDIATFEIIPSPSTVMAARGPAAFAQFFDEQAHVENSNAAASAAQVYDSATPALDQFGVDGFIYAPSSPWAKTGKFFENCQLSIEMEPDGTPSYPSRLLIQLPSWGPYEDWERAHEIPMTRPAIIEVRETYIGRQTKKVKGLPRKVPVERTRIIKVPDPNAKTFQPLAKAVQTYDDEMRAIERANPETFKVERRSHWSESLDAYLNPKKVDEMFEPWLSPTGLQAQYFTTAGILDETYFAHGDPSNSNKRFGWSLGHRVWVPKPMREGEYVEDGYWHVVFDLIRCWDPADFEGHTLDYDEVMGDIEVDVLNYLPQDVSFDQFNVPATIGRLRKFLASKKLPKNVTVREVSRTRTLNWNHAELFKSALNMGLVHAPLLLDEIDPETGTDKVAFAAKEAVKELKFLEMPRVGIVDHPTTGPVQTKDIADCHDSHTEVLTETGWRVFADVQEGQRVATRTTDGRLEYQHFTDRVDRHYAGPMLRYEGHRLDFLVTPGHRMWVSTGREIDFGFVRAEDLRGRAVYRTPKVAMMEDRPSASIEFDRRSHPPIPRGEGSGRGGDRSKTRWTEGEDRVLAGLYPSMAMDELCDQLPGRTRGSIYNRARVLGIQRGQIGDRYGDRPVALPPVARSLFGAFLGFWLAEGRKYHRGTHKGYGVRITQTKPEGIEWFDRLLTEMNWPHRRVVSEKETSWVISSYGLREYLRALCVDDHELVIPQEVFSEWSKEETQAVLVGLSWGDGNFSASKGVHTNYGSTSKMLVDDVQRLLVHLGRSGQVRMVQPAGIPVTRFLGDRDYHSNHAMWGIHFDTKPEAVVKMPRSEVVEYDGMVHCLTVPNGTLLTRRNGKSLWSGNCLFEVTVGLIGKQMATFLGMELSSVGLSGSAPLGTDPSRHTRTSTDPREALGRVTEGAGQGRGMQQRGGNPSRGMRRR